MSWYGGNMKVIEKDSGEIFLKMERFSLE